MHSYKIRIYLFIKIITNAKVNNNLSKTFNFIEIKSIIDLSVPV